MRFKNILQTGFVALPMAMIAASPANARDKNAPAIPMTTITEKMQTEGAVSFVVHGPKGGFVGSLDVNCKSQTVSLRRPLGYGAYSVIRFDKSGLGKNILEQSGHGFDKSPSILLAQFVVLGENILSPQYLCKDSKPDRPRIYDALDRAFPKLGLNI